MRSKKYLWSAIMCFGIAILILLPASCMVKVADLRLSNSFTGEGFNEGCLIKFGVINLGQKTAFNAVMLLELWDQINEKMITEYNIYLGDIKPNQVRQYKIEFLKIKWGLNIGFREGFKWD